MAQYRGLVFPVQKGLNGIPEMAEDADCVWNDVKLLFNTKRRSRVMRASFGMLLENIVFDNTGEIMKVKIYREIITAINNFEPRINVLGIDIKENKTEVTIDTLISIRGIKKTVTHTVQKNVV
jgi:phage baseplate assembly protein W